MSYQTYLSQTQRIQPCQSSQYCSKYGSIVLILLSLFFIFTCSVHANNLNTTCQIEITQQQVAPATSNNLNQLPTYGWSNIAHFPDVQPSIWQTSPTHVWYKIHWYYHCPDKANNPLTLVISHIKMAGKVYLNQDLLWQDQSLTEPLSRSWNTPRYWNLPSAAIKDGENILWVYAVGSSIDKPLLGSVHLGTYQQVFPYYQQYHFKQRTLLLISSIIYFTIGLFYFLAWLIYRSEKAYIWVSLVIALWLSYHYLFLLQSAYLTSDISGRLGAWIFSTYSLVGCIALWRFAHRKFILVEKYLFGLFIVISLIVLLTPAEYLPKAIFIIFMINVVIFVLQNITYPFIAYQTKQLEVYFLALIHLIYIPIALHDAHQFITNQNSFWSPYVTPLAALFVGSLLALRLNRNARTIAQFNHTLTDKIQLATQELENSLKTQHRLELENTKLQERMSLAHDLHDSLGGSLVRSMAIINQSTQNLNNQQFLSMLKILRDDLRQIIDTGSSSGNTPPDTPQIWGAAIRYRFIQIFDELDIHSEWRLPTEWHIQPTALECLTLLRVIEESLTNIIKHSNANNVKVELSFKQQSLILEIQDDGIGFDADAVFQSGMSIGLRSMQTRLEKIHAKLVVESEPGCTSVKVIKSFQ